MNVEYLVEPKQGQAQKLTILSYYDGQCCITGRHYNEYIVEMAHIFDAGLSEYKWLRMLPVNTLPIVRNRHQFGNNCFDYTGIQRRKRAPRDKIEWVLTGLPEDWEFLPRMKEQFSLLLNLVDSHE